MRLIDFPFKSALNKPVKLVCCQCWDCWSSPRVGLQVQSKAELIISFFTRLDLVWEPSRQLQPEILEVVSPLLRLNASTRG